MSSQLFRCEFEVPRHCSKKNEKRIGFKGSRPFIMKASKARDLEVYLIRKLSLEKAKLGIKTIEEDICASFILTYPSRVYFTKKNTRSNRVLDLSNGVQIYEDALSQAKVISDDRIICSLDGSRRMYHDKNTFLIEIILSRFD